MQQLITVLPTGIVGAIEAMATTKHQHGRFVRMLSYMLGKIITHEVDFDTPVDISREHCRHRFGTHYLKDLQALCNAGIVHTDDKYTPPKRDKHTGEKIAKGQCKRYTFNKDLVFTSPDFVTYHAETSKMFDADYVVRQTVQILSRLKCRLKESEMKKVVEGIVTDEYVLKQCKIDGDIPPGAYEVKGMDKTFNLPFILELAKKNGLNAILYNRKIHLSKLDVFVERTKGQIRTEHLRANGKLMDIRKRSNIHCSRNDTNNRLDTNLTNLKSNWLKEGNDGYIQYYELDGERLWSIDKCNSQPNFLAKVIEIWQSANNQHFSNEDISKNLNSLERCEAAKSSVGYVGDCWNNSSSSLSKLSYQHIIDTIPSISVTHFYKNEGKKEHLNDCNSKSLGTEKNMKTIITEKINMSDLEDFKAAARAGKFYETFQKILEKEEKRECTRDEVKKMMFVVLFAAAGYNPAEKKLLKKHFPNLVTFTNEFKRAWRDYYIDKGEDYATARQKGKASLAVILQQIESWIFIDCILTRLLKMGYRVFSKHDSILCKESDVPAVEAVVREVLDRELGVGTYALKTELA